ncbi:hypothetical protein ABIB95_003450 [Bradyrhizobium sp. LA2.1]
MGMVMIKCPETGRAIPTGINADQDSFRSSTVFFARSFCANCGTAHEWFARDAWLQEPNWARSAVRPFPDARHTRHG